MSDKPLAVVTGASSGIGRATALKLAQNNYQVIAAARREDRLQELARQAADIIAVPVDLADAAQLKDFCRLLASRPQPVRVLVNNAGYAVRGVVEDVPVKEARDLFEMNLFCHLEITQACLPAMRQARAGAIVNISSLVGRVTFPANATYSASKHAMESYTDALRFELAPLGIKVIAIRPGPIATEFMPTAIARTGPRMANSHPDYQPVYAALAALLQKLFGQSTPLGPEAVAEVIWKALNDPHPLPSYPVGPEAESFLAKRATMDEVQWVAFIKESLGLPG